MDLLSPKTAFLSQGISDKTTIASMDRNNNIPEVSIYSQEHFPNKEKISHEKIIKQNTSYIPSFLKNNGTALAEMNNSFDSFNPNSLKFKNIIAKYENINKEDSNNQKQFSNKYNAVVELFENKKSSVNDKPIQVNNNNVPSKLNLETIKMNNYKQNLSVKDKIENSPNQKFDELYLKTKKDHLLFKENPFSLGNIIDSHNKMYQKSNINEMPKKQFSPIDNCSKAYEIIKQKNPILESQKYKINNVKNSQNNVISTGNKIKGLEYDLENFEFNQSNLNIETPIISINNKNPIVNFNDLENEEIKKFNSWNPKKDINPYLTCASDKSKHLKESALENDNAIYQTNNSFNSCDNNIFLEPLKLNKKIKNIESTSNNEISNASSFYMKLDKKHKEISKDKYFNDFKFTEKSINNLKESKIDNHSYNYQYNFEKKFNNDLSKNDNILINEGLEAEYNDFNLECQFITNNKKIILKDNNPCSFLSKNKIGDANKEIELDYQDKKNQIAIDLSSNNVENNNKQNQFYLNSKERKLNINQEEKSFDSKMSCEFPSQVLNKDMIFTDKAYNYNLKDDCNNVIYNKNQFEIKNERNNSSDFVSKFNTSEAVKPPKIYLELNQVKNITTNDSTLIVNAEMDRKNNLLENIYGSYNGSNYKSNRSTSNESKDYNNTNNNNFNDNVNLGTINSYHSRDSVNNEYKYRSEGIYKNINLKTFNSSNSSNNNNNNNNDLLKINSNQLAYKINEQIDIEKKLIQANTNNKITSGNSLINTSNNLKKKPVQKNRIFFPTDIPLLNFNTNKEKN